METKWLKISKIVVCNLKNRTKTNIFLHCCQCLRVWFFGVDGFGKERVLRDLHFRTRWCILKITSIPPEVDFVLTTTADLQGQSGSLLHVWYPHSISHISPYSLQPALLPVAFSQFDVSVKKWVWPIQLEKNIFVFLKWLKNRIKESHSAVLKKVTFATHHPSNLPITPTIPSQSFVPPHYLGALRFLWLVPKVKLGMSKVACTCNPQLHSTITKPLSKHKQNGTHNIRSCTTDK